MEKAENLAFSLTLHKEGDKKWGKRSSEWEWAAEEEVGVGVGVGVRKIRELAIPCLLPSGLNLAFCLTSTSSLRVSRGSGALRRMLDDRNNQRIAHSLSFDFP